MQKLPEGLLAGIPIDLFFDCLRLISHASQLGLDRILKPSERLTPEQVEALKVVVSSIKSHRQRCSEAPLSSSVYDDLGLQGKDRCPEIVMLRRFTHAVELGSKATRAIRESAVSSDGVTHAKTREVDSLEETQIRGPFGIIKGESDA